MSDRRSGGRGRDTCDRVDDRRRDESRWKRDVNQHRDQRHSGAGGDYADRRGGGAQRSNPTQSFTGQAFAESELLNELPKKKFTGRCRLFVGNLPNECKDEELKELFKPHGEIAECCLSGKGFAFLRMRPRRQQKRERMDLEAARRDRTNQNTAMVRLPMGNVSAFQQASSYLQRRQQELEAARCDRMYKNTAMGSVSAFQQDPTFGMGGQIKKTITAPPTHHQQQIGGEQQSGGRPNVIEGVERLLQIFKSEPDRPQNGPSMGGGGGFNGSGFGGGPGGFRQGGPPVGFGQRGPNEERKKMHRRTIASTHHMDKDGEMRDIVVW